MTPKFELHDIIGTLGVLLIVSAYLLLQLGRISPANIKYSGINACGAALILYSLAYDFNISAFIIEAFWLVISGVGIGRAVLARRATRPE
ncbi:MAG: hypothetical protein KDA27_18935 [Candidatus Eisenbacteria bacterium]|uniref:CBU-0592-like domain-containing protein n=1 Tax=Eiseniibacteriota bacterium TaxID=2212470 RepID=A0A956NIW1_UNCEI|nr:hypothetical protein [Candidatus Eisenbacteria bacterium]